jgi:tetratricopeptide (TPR) repeat protein
MRTLNAFALGAVLLLAWPLVAQVESAKAPEAAPPAEGAAKAAVKAPISMEQYEASEFNAEVEAVQKQKSVIRKDTIGKLESLLREHPYYENKADVYFRLAEAYYEEEKYQFLVAMKEFDRVSEAFDKGLVKEKPDSPKERYDQSLEYYRRILREFPEYTRLDEVLYYLGKGAMQQGKATRDRQLQQEGENMLKRLVQSYPDSTLIPQSHLALAEYYFEGNSLFYAKINYEKIITNYQTSPMFNYALYKLAWVLYNLRDLDKSIETFKRVVEEVSASGEGRGKIQFREQALNDLVMVYAEVDEDDAWKAARDYFLTVLSAPDAYKKMYRMAELIQAADRHEVAIDMYRHFIEKEPNSQRVPEFYDRIYASVKDLNDQNRIDEFVKEIYRYFDPAGTWASVNKDNQEAVAAASGLVETGLMFVSNEAHRKAEKEKAPEGKRTLYAKAAEFYKLYIDRYPRSDKSYIVNFYYAEILFDQLQDWEKAAEQYQAVLDKDKKGEYVEDASLGVIYCMEKILIKAGLLEEAKKEGIEVVKIKNPGQKTDVIEESEKEIKETPLDPREKQYIDAADQYVKVMTDWLKDPELRKKYPDKGKKIPEIMFIAAKKFYEHGMFKDAVTRLQTIFQYDPKHKYASYSVFTLLDCYIRLHRWEKVEEWTRKLIAEKNFTVKSEAELKKYVAVAMTEQTKDQLAERKYSDAEAEMKAILKEFGRDPKLAAKITFNLAAVYERGHKLKQAVETYQSVATKFPNDDVAPRALFTIGELYENQTMFDKAARAFEAMERFKDDEDAPDALKNAGLIWEALGKYDDAITDYRKYVKLFATRKEVTDIPAVELHIGQVFEMKKTAADDKKAIAEYDNYVKKYKAGPQVVEALSRKGVLLVKADKDKNKREIIASFDGAMKAFGKLEGSQINDESKFFGAQAAFLLTEYLFDEFQATKINATNPYALKKLLTTKAEMHQKLEKTYQSILDYQSLQWNAACLFRIGYIYWDFARALLDAPVPEVLDADQQDEYRLTLEEFAGPIEEKSLTAFKTALSLAHEKGTYNEWSIQSAEYSAKVNPDDFPLPKEHLVKSDKVKDSLLSTNIIRTLRRGDVSVNLLEIVGEKKARGPQKMDFNLEEESKDKPKAEGKEGK